MRLRELISTVLPTLVDEIDGYENYEFNLSALDASGNEIAVSTIYIKRQDNNYSVTSSEVHILGTTGESETNSHTQEI